LYSGRLRQEDIALLDDLWHEAEQQREQQSSNVLAIDVGVGHQHDLVIAQPVDVELVTLDAGAQRRDDRLHLLVLQHTIEPGPLDIEDLPADGQDRLRLLVATLLGRAAGRVTLDDEQLALFGVGRLAVGELAGQAAAAEQALAAAAASRALRAASRANPALCALRAMSLPSLGFFSNHSPSRSLTTFCTNDFVSVLPSLVLVCPSNCGSASLTLTIATRPSRTSSPVRLASFS
jgi:hypothetical protein